MFDLEIGFLDRIKKSIELNISPAIAGPSIQYFCSTCQGGCKNSCSGSCSGSCKGSCTRSCTGNSR